MIELSFHWTSLVISLLYLTTGVQTLRYMVSERGPPESPVAHGMAVVLLWPLPVALEFIRGALAKPPKGEE